MVHPVSASASAIVADDTSVFILSSEVRLRKRYGGAAVPDNGRDNLPRLFALWILNVARNPAKESVDDEAEDEKRDEVRKTGHMILVSPSHSGGLTGDKEARQELRTAPPVKIPCACGEGVIVG